MEFMRARAPSHVLASKMEASSVSVSLPRGFFFCVLEGILMSSRNFGLSFVHTYCYEIKIFYVVITYGYLPVP